MKKNFSIYLQMLLLVVVLVFLVLFLFVSKKYFKLLELFLGIGLIVMAYNTQKYYQNNRATIFYLVFGTLLLVFDLLMLIGD